MFWIQNSILYIKLINFTYNYISIEYIKYIEMYKSIL